VTEIKTVPYVPLSHPFVERLFVERLFDTVRREYLDRILFWTTADLETKLLDFQHYYNGHRTDAGLDGRTRNRALTQVAHLQVSGHIDGSSIVAESIKRQ
jgi:putative transposase